MLFTALEPVIAAGRPFGGASLEAYLLTRHLAIDALLERAIEGAGVTQVVEIACGLSPRGWRFAQRYGERITYVEADLPGMAARKRAALDRIGCLSDHHRVVAVDALRDDGPDSLATLAETLRRRWWRRGHHRGPARLPGAGPRSTASGAGSPPCSPGSRRGATSPTCTSAAVQNPQVRIVPRPALGVRARTGAPPFRRSGAGGAGGARRRVCVGTAASGY